MTERRMHLKFLIVGVVFMLYLTQAEANITVCSPSNTNIVIDARVPGEISTPKFPDDSLDISCTWKIQAPENLRLEITIKDLKLTGVDDYLIIRDGAEAISPLIGKYGPCASGSLTLFSSGNFAFLQMVSSVFIANDKLRIAFKPTDPDDIDCSNGENPSNLCGLNTYLSGEPSGVVSSPNFPNNYGADRNCLWTIVAPPGYRVQFTIHWLGIEDHRYSRPGSCGDDSITISEYRGNYTNDVTVLCGCKRLFTFVSFMEKMWVRFSSYKKNNWPGFYAIYKFLAPEDCPAGKSNCSLTSTDVVGFDAQGQVCRTSVKTTTKVTNQETTSLLPSSVNALASSVSLGRTPALEITTSVHLTFSGSKRWQSNTSSPQETTAVERKKLGTVSSKTVSPTLLLPTVNASAGRIVHSSEVMKHTSVSLLRSNALELATFVPSSSSFTNQTLIQARSSFATVGDSNGTWPPIGQIKTPWVVSTSIEPASDVLGTKQATPLVPTSSLPRADLVISTSKREDFSSEGTSVKPSQASKVSPSAVQTTPVERPTTQYIPVTGTDNPLIGLEVKCTHYAMELTISRFLRPHLVIASLHLQDPACKVSFINDTHAFLSAPLDECGTQQNISEDYFIYINTMTGDEKSSKANAEITKKGRLKFEFQCSFKKLHVLSIVSYSPRRKAVRTSDDGVGNFTFEMDMFKDPNYDIVVNQYPVTLYSGQRMYFQVNVKSRDRSLLSFLEECWVTPTPDPRDQTRHVLIKQGCSHDSSLHYVYKKSSVQKFTFQGFRFLDEVSERLYVHCQVVTCRRSDTGSVCDRGCKKGRRHRRENKRFIMDKDVFLSLGPVKFQDQDEVPESYDGGNITLDSEAKIQVDCQPDYIEVFLQISDFPGLAVNDSVLHLEDKACVASYKDENMVKFTFGLEACMTTQEDDGKKMYYMNKVYLKAGQPADDQAITRVHAEIIPFKCGYDKKAVISKVSYSPRSTLVITDADGFGNFTYFMDMYEDESNNVTVTEFPKVVGLGQRMYFGFRVESGDSELVVFPDVCKATPSSSFDSTPVHLIIEDACSRDNTLSYQYEKKAQQFFNLAAFRFKEGYDDVYIHCKMTVCRSDDTGSRCDKGCGENRRRRRSSEDDMSADLYVGPLKPNFMTSNEDAKEYNHSGPKSTDSMIIVVGVVVGVLGTVAIALIVAVIIISQRGKSTRKEETFIISDDS